MTLDPSIDYRVVNPTRNISSVYDWVVQAAQHGHRVRISNGYVEDNGAVELDLDGEVGIERQGGEPAGTGYVTPESLVPYDAPVAPQDPATALEAARAEVARLEALVAADDAAVTERAEAMRRVYYADSYARTPADAWKAVARAFPAGS